ncbi:26S proteasome regulatory subunit-like protein [Thermochaetoides thermophila DSM 1495]|uniref:26S proteasome regulatory subunit-like protein n=1 Tax=Chaetomium thermophilum (strain DSM 1495 / CBS 144.50 / IMI 039719) TaxID=759272 RepID=G0RZK0_CHATD|nr:26S proteasome regulatory subunit-like protein [Thermochaetoides thermophila DSM 1495]EGS23628.1 26S proteasome regulatory subunit-like protein [Thermochaetoides thermophila DSM 1495]
MPLEAVMIVVDNSEPSRNGDYAPTRFDAQSDAVNIIFQHVVNGNPESSVGLMSMGGKDPEVLATLTTDQGKILEGLHQTRKKIRGHAHLSTGIQIASLALKHRQNKSQKARIIVFVCSPIQESEKELTQLSKKMKKNNISVDFVLFGDMDEENQSKLEAFNKEINGNTESSHLVIIPPSSKLLSDQLIATPILLGEGATSGSGGLAGDAGGENWEFGFDPATDPELALALRMSMEEEKARQERLKREQEEAAKKAGLESVKEEGETQPLLDKDGQPSGNNKDDDKGDKSGDGDKMDTS